MLDWTKHELESRFLGETSITSDMQMTSPLDRKQRGAEEPLEEGERREWKSWLKTQHSENEDHGIWFHHFMADGEKMETVTDFFSWAPESLQIMTVAMQLKDACSLERKLCLMHPAWAVSPLMVYLFQCCSLWCTGKTQRDRVGREAGAGIGMGNTCKSMADSCQCMAKTTTIL